MNSNGQNQNQNQTMSNSNSNQKTWFKRFKPLLAVVFLQICFAGMDILSKMALNKGMNTFVLSVYRHAVATVAMAPFAVIVDRHTRPKMTLPIFSKILLLSILEPVIGQNLYYIGMKYTTATFAAAMSNILPALTFVMACFFRLEKLQLKSLRTQAKILGTLATVAGAMIMTLVKGPILEMFWTKGRTNHVQSCAAAGAQNPVKGGLMITIGCFSWAAFVILQAITLKTYPAELSLTTLICLLGTIEGAVVTLVIEKGKTTIWEINWDTRLLAAVYSGITCSGISYYLQGVIMKERGPVYVTAFYPLNMVIVAIVGSIVLAEKMYLGRMLGAVVIVAGLYLVVWGKAKDQTSSPPSTTNEEPSPTTTR